MSVNKVILLGRLGQDPEIKYTPGGQAVASFSLATSESWNDKNSGQKQERTEWHRIVVWGKTAELCHQYLQKGRQLYLEGRLQTRSWDDKDSGQKRYMTEIVASSVQFIGSKDSSGGASRDMNEQNSDAPPSFGGNASSFRESTSQNPSFSDGPTFTADDIPF